MKEYIHNKSHSFWSFTRDRRFRGALIAGSLTTVLAIAVVLAVILPNYTQGQSFAMNEKPDKKANVTKNDRPDPRTAAYSFADIVQKVAPSVVTVRADVKETPSSNGMQGLMNDPFFRQFFGGQMPKPQPRMEHALGSGVIIRSDGIVVTNNHVVDNAQKITVELSDRQTFPAKVLGTDPLSDLAVLKIQSKDLPAIQIGNSDKARVGDVVLAIGNPLGLRQTVTSGIISAKGRQTGVSDGSFEDFIQTDAPINRGNSGGALVDVNGELIGINSQILSPSGGNIGIGFAIPSNMVKAVVDQLIATGKVQRGMLGIGIQDLNSNLAKSFGMKDENGVLINSVTPGSPAEAAGLKQGDVIVEFNGTKVNNANHFRNEVAGQKPGSVVELGVLRNGSKVVLKATLTEFKLQNQQGQETGSGNQGSDEGNTGGKLGLTLQPLTPELAGRLNLNSVAGMVVTGIVPGSKAEDAGLAQGDVILQINRKPVNSLADVRAAIASGGDKPLLVLVDRANQTFFTTL